MSIDAMDIDSDSSSDESDVSALSTDRVEEIESLLKTTVDFPSPCPVCLGAGYRAKQIKDITALRQHAEIKAKERSDEMRKVQDFHRQLISKLDREEEIQSMTKEMVVVPSSVDPVIAGTDVQFTDKIEDNKLEREQFKKKREGLSDLMTKKQKFLRTTIENKARSRELEEKVREYRDTRMQQQEALQKELQEYDQELKGMEDEKNRMLSVQERTREEFAKLCSETEGSSDDTSKWTVSLTQKIIACNEIKEKCTNLSEERRSLEASMKKQSSKWNVASKVMDKLIADFEKFRETKPEEMDEEHPVVIGVSQLTILGINPVKLPTKCGKCRQPFEGSEARVILGICCCVDYCQKCIQMKRLLECPRHKVSVGKVMRFSMNC